MLSVEDVREILAIDLLGVIPESPAVLSASNQGIPITLDADSDAKFAYRAAVAKLLGETEVVQTTNKGWNFLKNMRIFKGETA